MNRRILLLLLCFPIFPLMSGSARGAETLLLQSPTVSKEQVVFVFARDLWVVGREGGIARRLTSHVGRETRPHLSPDGRQVAFTGEYEGNSDVYVMSVAGGPPRRLTWHPLPDAVEGWHPDGTRVLFSSMRGLGTPTTRLFLAPLDGGMPEPMVMPRANHGSIHPSGKTVAYTPHRDPFASWKRHRGGTVTPIWLFDLATHELRVVPRQNASDSFPCWIGDVLYFASDRSGQMNVWRFRAGAKAAEPVTHYTDIGVRRLSAGAGVLVFERAGAIHLYDPEGGTTTRLRIEARTDGQHRLPRWLEAKGLVRNASVSPNGMRAVFEARGEIITVPREHGDARNLSLSPGEHDRSPAWSPDGTRIAWLTDATGEYEIRIRDRRGREAAEDFPLDGAGFYYRPLWSPESDRILFTDKANRIAYLTAETGEITQVSKTQGGLGYWRPAAVWSPDGRWIAFERKNSLTSYTGVSLFEVETGKTVTVTDGFAHASSPAFSRDGKHLFFKASVDSGPRMYGLDMSSRAARRVSSSLYVTVLKADGEDPVAPRSDDEEAEDQEDEEGEEEDGEGEEGGEEAAGAAEPEKDSPSIDLEGIDQRILALPLGSGEYSGLECSKGGLLFIERSRTGGRTLKRFSFESRKTDDVASDISGFSVAARGEHLLLRQGSSWSITNESGKDRKGLRIDSVRLRVEPGVEWPQILREAWRIQREFFYDPNLHHVDWDEVWKRWSAFLPHVQHRDDLNLLIREMIGELCCGHESAGGGDAPSAPSGARVGLIGADFTTADGRHRFAGILEGQNWNPGLRAPLTVPGVDVREGDYLISVDGRSVTSDENLFAVFEGTVGRQVEIGVATTADGEDVRVSTVVPVSSEFSLRRKAWVEANRRRVDGLSDGRLAYVYLPNTGGAGMAAFDRDFYSQIDRRGAIIDERFNGGGLVADYIVSVLNREVLCYWMNREGWVGQSPFGTLSGPKVMIINERAGSGGDCLPWMFRKLGIGPLVGTRTWGGLVGISGSPRLLDGGYVSAAGFGIMDVDGNWVVENVGVAPDVEVIQWPREVIAGRDPQLERAVEIALEALAGHPERRRPEYKPPTPR